MFSKTCEYAIRAMIFIAQKSKQQCKTGIKEIAKEIGAPEHFIAKILQDLCRNGLLQSSKGPTGGFYLDAGLQQSTLIEIVKVIDGDKLFRGCALGLNSCSEKKPCPLHHQFKTIRQEIYEMLKNARLDELQGQLESQLAFLKH